jgi:mRNA interferase MazF
MTDLKKWNIVLIDLDPTVGSEIKKTRPCLIISPNAANKHLKTVIVAPLTSALRTIPTRLSVIFKGVEGNVCFDQIRTVDKSRIVKVQGNLDMKYRESVNELLLNLFDEL